ncbi:NB-ARC domain-containing protein [uncultured Pontibacter sp.]|uniref:tetratricopeptide repeat protein n=1 Tax=uncultured Pontibacter sp. TaxID=453356 RepID=UPI00260563B4|nr:NB-ARC domain-containing protein [uncultured Pontibacter sp.]
MKFNRRDLGYTIISRFESLFRSYIATKLECLAENYTNNVPEGILSKAKDRNYETSYFESTIDFLDNTDFPDLIEICCFKNNFSSYFSKSKREEIVAKMAILYNLRCKIAHVKGFFTSIDLDKLIELTSEVNSASSNDGEFRNFIIDLERSPEKFIREVPIDFNIDFLENNNVLNNLPIPDYEYEGGFVGREEDIKKIISYLNGDKFAVITITGAGGVGKTSLALKVVQELSQKPDFDKFDGIIWLSAKENKLTHLGIEDIEPTIKSYEELLDTIIEVLNFDVADSVEKKEDIVNTIFEISKGILIIVDNLETITDERIINFIIDAPNSAKFLITSRKGLGQVERRHELTPLKEKEAIYLFRQTAKDKQLLPLSRLDDKLVRKYVLKVSCFPLAIKWVIGLVARGKDINRVIDSINDATGDISKFCFEQIFSDLSQNCKHILYAISCFDDSPTAGVLQYVVNIEQNAFEDAIEELILVSLIIPEQFKNEQDEIAVKYSIIPLTRGFIRQQLNKKLELKEKIESTISKTQNAITDTEKAKREYRYSLNNLGAVTEEEKVAAVLVQSASQNYQANRYEDAVENYKSAISIAPRFSTIYRNWAVMESMEGHLSEADSLMSKAKELNPNDPQIWLLWGNIYKKANKFTEAHQKYEQAYILVPSDHIVLNALAQTKNRLGDFETADNLYKKALSIGIETNSKKHEIINRSSLAENLMSWTELLLKDRNYPLAEAKLFEAEEQCKRLIEIDEFDPTSKALQSQFYFRTGIYFKKVGKINEALTYFQRLLYISPLSNKEDYYIVGGTLEYIQLEINKGEYNSLLELLLPLKHKYSAVFQKKTYYLDRYNNFLEELENTNHQSRHNKSLKYNEDYKIGFIKEVFVRRNFVIIESEGKTFLGGAEKFDPIVDNVDNNLISKKVRFKTFKSGNKEKAQEIILI